MLIPPTRAKRLRQNRQRYPFFGIHIDELPLFCKRNDRCGPLSEIPYPVTVQPAERLSYLPIDKLSILLIAFSGKIRYTTQ